MNRLISLNLLITILAWLSGKLQSVAHDTRTSANRDVARAEALHHKASLKYAEADKAQRIAGRVEQLIA